MARTPREAAEYWDAFRILTKVRTTIGKMSSSGGRSEMRINTRYKTIHQADISGDVDRVIIPLGIESECLEIRVLNDPPEVVVLRHGMGFPEKGEAVWSELLPGEL